MRPGHLDPAQNDVAEAVSAYRLMAAAAAVVLALAGRGSVLVLGGLLAVVAASRLASVSAVVAAVAVQLRWGTASLSAVAGGQAVLGPAVALGSTRAAAAMALAALTVALLAPRPAVLAVAVGVVAGAVAAGPEVPHDMGVRLAGAAAGTIVALAARWLPFRGPLALAAALLAVAAAA